MRDKNGGINFQLTTFMILPLCPLAVQQKTKKYDKIVKNIKKGCQ